MVLWLQPDAIEMHNQTLRVSVRMAPAVAMLVVGCAQTEVPLAEDEQAVGGCVTANQNETQAASIATQTGVFEAAWDVTPTAGTDSGVGFSPLTSPAGWASMATITRFSGSVIDVRDFDAYRADAVMGWTAGSTYHVRTIVDVPAKTYSVFVTGPTGDEQTLATNYRFRSEQAGATQLVTSVVNTGTTGSITACGLALSSCVTAGAGSTINTAFPSQSGSFSASWDMTPLATAIDAGVGLSPTTTASAWTDLATIGRFATTPSDLIDARNGANYDHAVTIPWMVNGNYRVRLAINVPAHTYSIYVASPGGAEQTLGASYAFRTEQSGATQLQSWVVRSSTGSARACNFQTSGGAGSAYNSAVLADGPVAFWAMAGGGSSEPDLTGNDHTGTYVNGTTASTMPNGDPVVVFDGSSQYLRVASSAALSIPNTHTFTWEAWIKPTTLQFPNSPNGYVQYMGKCEHYSPTCEWEARMYNANASGNSNKLCAYAFKNAAGLGSGASWQPTSGLFVAGHWYHVVGEYTTLTTRPDCNPQTPPGQIDIWVNGVKWNSSVHGQTGCMSQYDVTPTASTSDVLIGTMTASATDAWFQGAIGKVAIYDHLLTPAQISAHYQAMTGAAPNGSCGSAGTCTLANP